MRTQRETEIRRWCNVCGKRDRGARKANSDVLKGGDDASLKAGERNNVESYGNDSLRKFGT